MFRPLHQSPVFTEQVAAYTRLGQRAWSDGVVAWRATTCPLLADIEAEVIAGFDATLRQTGALGEGQVLPVIDVGAGNGRLGFHLAPRLEQRGVRACVVLTDVVASNVEALARQPQLAALASRGLVRFEPFDALAPTPRSGPVVLLAHYLFDSLPHRAFRRSSAGTFELWFDDETWGWREEPSALPVELQHRGDGTWLLPVGAIRALESFRAAFDGPVLVLVADKGVTPRGPDEDPLLARHESVSAGVDFEALAAASPRWTHHGPTERDDTFSLHAFGTKPTTWPGRAARNEVSALLRDLAAMNGPEVLRLFERSLFDPDVIAQAVPVLLRERVDEALRAPLLNAVLRGAQLHYRFRQQLDVPFALAGLAHHLGALELASALYRRSLDESGVHPSTLVNLALAQDGLGRREVATQLLEALLAEAPDHPRANELLSAWRRP